MPLSITKSGLGCWLGGLFIANIEPAKPSTNAWGEGGVGDAAGSKTPLCKLVGVAEVAPELVVLHSSWLVSCPLISVGVMLSIVESGLGCLFGGLLTADIETSEPSATAWSEGVGCAVGSETPLCKLVRVVEVAPDLVVLDSSWLVSCLLISVAVMRSNVEPWLRLQ